MDVLSIEHNFGKEIETSIQQLFIFFCNNINLGQWQMVKACLKQLHANKKNLKFDLNEALNSIIKNPSLCSHGSLTLQSHYHISLLLYEFCVENEYFPKKEDIFYDRIMLKFIIHSSLANKSANINSIKIPQNDDSQYDQSKHVIDELMIFLNENREKAAETSKSTATSLDSSYLSIKSEDLLMQRKTSSMNSLPDLNDLSKQTFEYLKDLFLTDTVKAIGLIEIIFKYNQKSKFIFLKVHLAAINNILDELNTDTIQDESEKSPINIMYKLLHYFSLYDFNYGILNDQNDKPISSKFDNIAQESLALLQRAFKELCNKFYFLLGNNFEKLDQLFCKIYSCFVNDLESEIENETEKLDKNVSNSNNLLNIFAKIHYETDHHQIVSNTLNDFNFPILSMIKMFSNQNNNNYILWRKFFIFSYMEKKILLRAVIDECLLTIEKAQFDNLVLILNIKEFSNLKPLILLIGISRVSDLQSAKKLIASICLNSEKGSLIDKIGNLIKTHLDFITWLLQIKSENRKKEIHFSELIKILHKQLPLNIMNQYIDISKFNHSEMTKILKNTLIDKDNMNQKTKWVRFVDEVNEKISLIQENCLAIYNGFFCLNQIVESILYCCENMNTKLNNYQFNKSLNNKTASAFLITNESKKINLEKIQTDYDEQVLNKLEIVKNIVNQIKPISYRLEILENIYSLIYLSSNDLKEEEVDENDVTDDELINDNINNKESDEGKEKNNFSKSINDEYEIVSESNIQASIKLSKNNEQIEYSIYQANNNNNNNNQLKDQYSLNNHSVKSNYGSYSICSNESINRRSRKKNGRGERSNHSSTNGINEEDYDSNNARTKNRKTDIYRLNAAGGSTFLINDFMCRDILLLLKDLIKNLSQDNTFNIENRNSISRSFSSSVLYNSSPTKQEEFEFNSRYSKLQQIVDDTLWRFELIKTDDLTLEYGKINLLNIRNETDLKQMKNEEVFIYEMIKEKKLTHQSSNSSVFNEQAKQESNFLSLQSQQSFQQRKSIGSQRSLSVIYPPNKHKKSNSTVMKLLSNLDTLSTLCLKEEKYAKANELYKKLSSSQGIINNKKSFEFNQILYRSIYEKTIDGLKSLSNKFDVKNSSKTTNQQQNLISLSLQSLDLVKITDQLLSFEKESKLLQCIFLCDTILITNIDLKLASNLIEYANVRLNQNVSDLKRDENDPSNASYRRTKATSNVNNINNNSSDDEEDKQPTNKHAQGNSNRTSKLENNENNNVIIDEYKSESLKFEQEMMAKLTKFLENTQKICNQFSEKKFLNNLNNIREFLFDMNGVSFDLQNSIEKFEIITNLNINLNELKSKFEDALLSDTNAQDLNDHFNKMIDFLNESIKLSENGDIISSFFYKNNGFNSKSHAYNRQLSSHERYSNSLSNSFKNDLVGSYNNRNELFNSLEYARGSNYLLSFYEYCKTLYEYFKEKTTTINSSFFSNALTIFSILNSSPASLICKLLFDDSIKPQLLESLTQKLHLNLTAIILHNSCPRLKLTIESNNSFILPIEFTAATVPTNMEYPNKTLLRQASTKSRANTMALPTNKNLSSVISIIEQTNYNESVSIYNLNSFYTILNESEIFCCSRKKPDEFIRNLLLKLLKYLENYLNKHNTSTPSQNPVFSVGTDINETIEKNKQKSIDLKLAKEIYKCPEFKSIINESQELQKINLYFLKNDDQKLSFFINLYNLLSIHSKFYLASITCFNNSTSSTCNPNQIQILNQTKSETNLIESLFRNKTEEILFEQRVCYKVGQMGCLSLYDLKHHILIRRSLNNDNPLNFKAQNTNKNIQETGSSNNNNSKKLATRSNKSPKKKQTGVTLEETSDDEKIDLEPFKIEPLYKYSFFKLDLDADPMLWSNFLPSEKICDYRILFALTNCTESDLPICVFNSDHLLNDQLDMQMKLFLNDSIYVDMCEDVLYLPSFLIENCSFFDSYQKNTFKKQQESENNQSTYIMDENEKTDDLYNFVRFLIDNSDRVLKDSLTSLLELDSIHGFAENIDQYGQKELPFPIKKIPNSDKFSLIISYNYTSNNVLTNNVDSTGNINQIDSNLSWYRKFHHNIEREKKVQYELKTNNKKQSVVSSNSNEDNSNSMQTSNDHDTSQISQQSINNELNQDCLDYIQKNSPLISNSLSFLFDTNKRNDFFKLLDDENSFIANNTSSTDNFLNSNSLNRFIQLYVPLKYMKHLSIQTKLNLVTQFLLTNKTDESKIELIIDLANYYAQKQEWSLVMSLLNNCTQDSEEFNSIINNNSYANINDKSTINNNPVKSSMNEKCSRFSQKDLYNLYDHACVCQSFQEFKTNEKSYTHLFKIKNFLKQVRAIFGLMYLWPIDNCLEMIDFCLTKSKLIEKSYGFDNGYSLIDEYTEYHDNLIRILNEKKEEFLAYKELTKCARQTLEKYYEHQQIQDAAGFYDELFNANVNTLSLINNPNHLNKMKKICQKCLTWQYAKCQLESSTTDEETNESIMDLFLLNDQFICAKKLIKKLNLSRNLQFKLDFGHLKHRLLNLNVSSSIIVVDFECILKECVSFADINLNEEVKDSNYLFEICYKLINELKDLNELNNQVLVSLCDFLINNYKHLINQQQINDFKIIQLTAKTFQILVQESTVINFDSYKRHHSNPLLIIEQLLMNSHIDLCSKTIKLCRETTINNDDDFHLKINQLLVKYARKALEFKIYPKPTLTDETHTASSSKSNSPQSFSSFSTISLTSNKSNNFIVNANIKKRTSIIPNDILTSTASLSTNTHSSPNTSLSKTKFVMPSVPPSKEEWVKDDQVQECMVCDTGRFTLLNRRHHCRRCGRVVCSNCSQRVTLIDNVLKRTCDDCFKQIEILKTDEEKKLQYQEMNDTSESIGAGLKKITKTKKVSNNLTQDQDEFNKNNNNEEMIFWQLIGGSDNETSQRRDEQVRNSFRYQQAPSTSLCLSILDLHNQPLECGKLLLNMCDELSNYLQSTNYQVEDFALIISMIKNLLNNAKVKLLQNSSTNMISMCDTYLSLIDILEQLLLANCSVIPSLNELRNTEQARRIRNRLLEEERHELAMNFSTKCGLDTQSVWASWGLIELRRGNYKEARNKFEKCLKPITEKHISITQTQLKIVQDIVSYFENAPPIKMMGPQTLLEPLRCIETLISEPKLYSNADSNLDEIQLKESLYYLETYGNFSLLLSFYQRHGYIEKALHYLVEKKCNSDIFTETLLIPCLKTGEFYQLLEYMFGFERYQNKLSIYYVAIGKYLEKNGYSNTLYDFQLLMKDYVRACMSCICFYTRNCSGYTDLYNNLNYLNKAREHLEQYLEICSIRQQTNLMQQQQKNKLEQQQLNKQMSAIEINDYLNAINLQIEVTKFIYNCNKEYNNNENKEKILNQKTPTLFGSNDIKINLCCLILLSGQSIQEGFGFVIRIIQCFNLNSTLVYSQIARELAKKYNFKEINNLLKCINESGYKDDINASYDECISTCIRVFASATSNNTNESSTNSTNIYVNLQQQNQYNKEIEDLIQLIKNDENKINAYILNGRLKSAYLIAIRMERIDLVKHIAKVAERMGQNMIKDICNKWLEKKQESISK